MMCSPTGRSSAASSNSRRREMPWGFQGSATHGEHRQRPRAAVRSHHWSLGAEGQLGSGAAAAFLVADLAILSHCLASVSQPCRSTHSLARAPSSQQAFAYCRYLSAFESMGAPRQCVEWSGNSSS
jgi:hypothetical protein